MVEQFADMSGRVAVVTGASSGIGRAVAVTLAGAGADVVVHCGRSVKRAEQVAKEIITLGRRAVVLSSDLSETSNCRTFLDEAWSAIGEPTIWVNNAGVDLLTTGHRDAAYEEKLDLLYEVDVRASVVLSKWVADRMRSGRQQGRDGDRAIITIGWDQSDRGMDGDSGELFSAAKNAVMGVTRSLAVSYAPEVRINCVAPGWIRTAWGERAPDYWQERVLSETPLKRWGEPSDIANAVRFLCSNDASYITGQVINVNGGAVR